MKVAIIGAGIGGLTLAVALKKAGVSFVVYEATAVIKPVGAGIAIANNAMQVYRHLGLAEQLIAKGVRISTVMLTDFTLNVLDETPLASFEQKYQLANIAIHRSELHQVLVDAVGVEHIHLNKRLHDIALDSKGKYTLEFEDHSTMAHDYVIGADGLRSKVRQLLFGDYQLRDARQVCWRGVLPFTLPSNYANVVVESWGKGKRLGFVQLSDKQVYWYYLIEEHIYQDQTTVEDYIEESPKWIQEMILQTEREVIHCDKIYDVTPFSNWYKNSACLIGDAAHATTPNLGQGACQAIEDVYVISKLLERCSLAEALENTPQYGKIKYMPSFEIVGL